MPKQPADEPLQFDRSKLRKSGGKSSSPVLKILLALLAGGFLLFACCAGWFAYNVYQGFETARLRQADKADPIATTEDAFQAANRQIAVNTGSAARGNSDEAIKLAGEFSRNIHALREAYFTKRKKEPLFTLSDGEFLTYCRLDDESCVFLVHVPDLRKFTKDAKSDLADLAWATAQMVVRSNVELPPSRLAVGLRGALLYDTAMVGVLQPEHEQASDGIESRDSGTDCRKLLIPFFKGDMSMKGAAAAEAAVPEMPDNDDEDGDETRQEDL